MHGWIASGRSLSRNPLWSALPGVLAILITAILFLGFEWFSDYLPESDTRVFLQRSINSVGIGALGALGIGFLLTTIFRDRKVYLAHLRKGELSLAQAESIITATHDAAIVIDEYGRIQSLNPAAEKMFDQTMAKVIGQNVSLLIPDRSLWQERAAFPRIGAGTGHRRGYDPFPIDYSFSEVTFEANRLIVALVRDASEHGRVDDTLRHIGLGVAPTQGGDLIRVLLRQLTKALEIKRVFMVEILGEGQNAIAMLTAAENGEMRGAISIDLRNSACAEVLARGFRFIPEGAPQLFPEDAMLAENGVKGFAALPLVDNRGKAVGVIGVLSEGPLEDPQKIESTLQIFASRAVTEVDRKRWEESLSAERERLAVTLRSIGDACITLDNDGRVVMFNPVAERLTGWIHEDAAGKLVHDVLHLLDERTRRRSQHLMQRIVTNGLTDAPGILNVLVSREGDERLVETSSSPIRDRAGRKLGAIIVLRDVTERQHADEERQKAEKLESLGLVAGGIAHDFNNILTTILGNVSLALGNDGVPTGITDRLAAARKAAQRAQELAGQLLTFAKGGAPIKQVTNLGQLLTDTVNVAVAGSRSTCDTTIPEDLWAVEADPGQIAQVIANLTVNADQAMPSGGGIAVAAENFELPLDSVSLGLRAGRWVHFSIEDRGVGIPEQYLKKIFDPYFTTKATGSGLGLATVYSIIKNHGGVILVESTPAVGSKFNVYLPASEKKIETPPPAPAPAPPSGGRVLVLDDEEAICMLVTCALEPLGYEVTETQDGLVALEKYQESMREGRKYDLVISDLTMPGRMSGQEAIRRLRELDPDVRAIVSSGYANDPVMSRYQEFGFCGMIAKPYEIDALGRKVAEVMAQVTPSPAQRVIYHSFEPAKTSSKAS